MSSVLSGLVQTMAEERASEAPGWDIPLHSLFKFISKAMVSQLFWPQTFYKCCRVTHNTNILVSHHRSDSKNIDDPVYHRERILKTSTLSCNEEKEEITKPPTR
jgi:hypothetical protein